MIKYKLVELELLGGGVIRIERNSGDLADACVAKLVSREVTSTEGTSEAAILGLIERLKNEADYVANVLTEFLKRGGMS